MSGLFGTAPRASLYASSPALDPHGCRGTACTAPACCMTMATRVVANSTLPILLILSPATYLVDNWKSKGRAWTTSLVLVSPGLSNTQGASNLLSHDADDHDTRTTTFRVDD